MVHMNILCVSWTFGLVIKQESRPLFSDQPHVADVMGSNGIISGNHFFSRSFLEAISHEKLLMGNECSHECLTSVRPPSTAEEGV